MDREIGDKEAGLFHSFRPSRSVRGRVVAATVAFVYVFYMHAGWFSC